MSTDAVLVNGSPVDYSGLPESLRGGMQRYIEHRIEPGSFLAAVLENDLWRSCEYADEANYQRLHQIVRWLYNHAPAACWGSAANVEQWLDETEDGE
jgi:hypothetical protein